MKWYSGKVLRGEQAGRTIGFPTVNLDPQILGDDIQDIKEGIYASQVKHQDKIYIGALYIGPRLVKDETHSILEIFIFDFDQEIYGETIEFTLDTFVRGVEDFNSMEEMKLRIEEDIREVREAFEKI